jgi:hypothetical protein
MTKIKLFTYSKEYLDEVNANSPYEKLIKDWSGKFGNTDQGPPDPPPDELLVISHNKATGQSMVSIRNFSGALDREKWIAILESTKALIKYGETKKIKP